MSTVRNRRRAQCSSPNLLDVIARVEAAAIAADLAPAPDEVGDLLDLFDARGYRRPPQTLSGFHVGREPNNKDQKYPPNPPTVQECMRMLGAAERHGRYADHGMRLQAAIILMWQGALRADEALSIRDDDLEQAAGKIRVREGKGGKSATITMAAWAWPLLDPWRARRHSYPIGDGTLLCVLNKETAGREWSYSDLNREVHKLATRVGIEIRDPEQKNKLVGGKRVSPHQFRHAWAIQAYVAGVALRTIQLHLRHENIGITDTYLRGLGADVSLEEVHQLPEPTVPATIMLELAKAPATESRELVLA